LTDTKFELVDEQIRAGEPERPEPHDLAGAILFFHQDPEHFKNWNGAGARVGAGIN